MIGYVIVGLTILATLVPLVLRAIEWKQRWSVKRYGGSLVRFENVTESAELAGLLELGNETVRAVIAEQYPNAPQLLDYRVIVRPIPVGGDATYKEERCFPMTRAAFVAIVPPKNAAHYIAHEVSMHIVPFRLFGDADPEMADGKGRRTDTPPIQAEIKRRLDAALRSSTACSDCRVV